MTVSTAPNLYQRILRRRSGYCSDTSRDPSIRPAESNTVRVENRPFEMAVPGDVSLTALFGTVMLLTGGIVLLVSGRYIWRATAVFRAAELEAIEDMTPGTIVRVSGTVVQNDADLIVAPFSGIDCAALRYQVEERRVGLPNLLPWYVTIHEATGAVEFAVQTTAGTLPIVDSVQTVILTTEFIETTSAKTTPAERIRAFEQGHDDILTSTIWQQPPSVLVPIFRVLSLGTRRYSEQRAARGADVTVIGRVSQDETGIDPLIISDRSPTSTLFRMAGTSIMGLLTAIIGLSLGYFLLVLG